MLFGDRWRRRVRCRRGRPPHRSPVRSKSPLDARRGDLGPPRGGSTRNSKTTPCSATETQSATVNPSTALPLRDSCAGVIAVPVSPPVPQLCTSRAEGRCGFLAALRSARCRRASGSALGSARTERDTDDLHASAHRIAALSTDRQVGCRASTIRAHQGIAHFFASSAHGLVAMAPTTAWPPAPT
jgi:hypothetical protein